MPRSLVLDSQPLWLLISATPGPATTNVKTMLNAALNQGSEVYVPAAVLAELYRSSSRVQSVDAWLSRTAPVRISNTDRHLARRVGSVLARSGRGSEDHVDATVVATALEAGSSVIVTGDPDDLLSLAAPFFPTISVIDI